MKTSFFILLSLFCLKGFSQSSILITNITNTNTPIALSPNTIVAASTTISSTTAHDFDIKNTGSTTKAYIVKRYDVALHNNMPTTTVTALAHFCFNGSCYTETTYTAGPLTLGPGVSASDLQGVNNYITTDLDEMNTVGYSYIKYTVYDNANHSDSVQFSIKYNGTLGMNELSSNALSAVELFPNPATDATVLKVTAQKPADAKVLIYNALGAVVLERPIAISEGKNKIDLDIAELNPGLYFAQLKMANNSVTKRLIVK